MPGCACDRARRSACASGSANPSSRCANFHSSHPDSRRAKPGSRATNSPSRDTRAESRGSYCDPKRTRSRRYSQCGCCSATATQRIGAGRSGCAHGVPGHRPGTGRDPNLSPRSHRASTLARHAKRSSATAVETRKHKGPKRNRKEGLFSPDHQSLVRISASEPPAAGSPVSAAVALARCW